jgi:predicted dehydrogenase
MSSLRLSRRDVIRSAAGAAAAPLFVPGSILGKEEKAAANERVAIGHIGVGGRGRSLMSWFLNNDLAQSVAASDAYSNKRDAFVARTKGKAYADFRELLAQDDIDAVVIATPDHWHVPMAVAAARAGKDAYVEKPLGVSIEQDLICRKVFRDNKRIFQYGTQQRSMNPCQKGCELVRQGLIGELKRIEVVAPNGRGGGNVNPTDPPATLDYDMWCGPAPVNPYSPGRCRPPGTYWVYDYSIGYLGGWGAHPLDIMLWGCDADQIGPVTVEGTGDITPDALYDTVHNWDMDINFGGQVEMKFTPGRDSTKFIGTDGWVRVWRGGCDAEPKSLLQKEFPKDQQILPDSVRHDINFVRGVISREDPVSNIDHAVRSDIISLLCDIAVRLERKITWDPRKETIVGDPEAAKLMHRDMREPWGLEA